MQGTEVPEGKGSMKRLISLFFSAVLTVSALFPHIRLTVDAEQEDTSAVSEFPVQSETAEDSGTGLKTVTQDDLAYVRSQLVSRNRQFTLSVPYNPDLYEADLRKEIIEAAMAHTGQPREGDYLLFQHMTGNYGLYTKDEITAIDFTFTYFTDAEQEKQVDEAVDALLKELNVYDASDYMKILTVFRWMTGHITYDEEEHGLDDYVPYSAYGAIIRRSCKCQGYAVLFYRLMLELGIDCRVVDGIGNGDFHAWNLVRLRNRYYYIDATFGATSSDPYEFFLMGTASDSFRRFYVLMDQYKTAEFTSKYPAAKESYELQDGDSDEVLFYDVMNPSAYYYKAVYWAAENGITNGYTEPGTAAKSFKPDNMCTREAVVTFLWRLAGKPEPKSLKSPFKDVQDRNKYYYKAVLWASEQGITKGYSNGTFKPDGACLREHVVTFLWRYAKMPSPKTSKNPFNDVKSSDYYYKAVLWASEKGITNGYSSGQYAGGFGPKLGCLREHVVTFLYRFAK